MSKKLCIECNTKGKLHSKLKKILCAECCCLNKYTLLTKTFTKDNYFLKDDYLFNLDTIDDNNSYGPIIYFFKSNIINKTCKKYNINDYELDNFLNNMKDEKRKKERI
jgi:hypothetical protein